VKKDGKTYFVIRDYKKLRKLFGDLLREIQRIKSEGDYAAGKALVETYGVKVDPEIHKEVLERNSKFKSAPYSGFINPVLKPVTDDKGEITDIKVTQPESFAAQMLEYAKEYSTLPDEN
ncbi:MAG: dihydrofolate reductase, partial [Flavobacteriia bacterium]